MPFALHPRKQTRDHVQSVCVRTHEVVVLRAIFLPEARSTLDSGRDDIGAECV